MKRLAETEAFKLLEERAQLEAEIAQEVDAGEWVHPRTLYRYRVVKRKLEDFRIRESA